MKKGKYGIFLQFDLEIVQLNKYFLIYVTCQLTI